MVGTVVILGSLHMIAPDHWVPLMVVSRKLKYSDTKTYSNAAGLGALHAITSEAVAGVALFIGIYLVKSFLRYLEIASIVLLVIVGVYFLLNGYAEPDQEDGYSASSIRSIIGISAFPDFALIPIMLAVAPLSLISVFTILIVFVLVSGFSLFVMIYGALKGFSIALEKLPPRYIDYVMGMVLFITAAIVASTSF